MFKFYRSFNKPNKNDSLDLHSVAPKYGQVKQFEYLAVDFEC